MVLLDLFFTFFIIGTVSFGGGYGMIPLVRSLVIEKGWLDAMGVSNIIAIAETSPGPIAVNMATYVGSVVGGFFGSVLATIGVVLPAFIIILIISKILKRIKDNKYVNAFLNGVKPVIIALVLSIGVFMVIEAVYVNFGVFTEPINFDFIALALMLSLIVTKIAYKAAFKKDLSPIFMIIMSACAGMIIF